MTRSEINERAKRYVDCVKESDDKVVTMECIIKDVANTESNRIYDWIRTNLGDEAANKFIEADI